MPRSWTKRSQLEAVELGFEGGPLGAFADDLQGGGDVAIAELGDGVEEDGEAFEVDEPADADEAERGVGRAGGGGGKLAGVDAVVDAVDAVGGVGTNVG